MAGSYKLLKTIFLLLAIVRLSSPQEPLLTVQDISRNFCDENQALDNFSCNGDPLRGLACFSRSRLCDGIFDCNDQADEGNDDALSSLECNQQPSGMYCSLINIILCNVCLMQIN